MAIIFGDIVNPETGKTFRQENQELKHNIPLGTLVEVDCDYVPEHGTRAFVVQHGRDCDGTPLYGLSLNKEDIDLDKMENQYLKFIYKYRINSGWSEDSLKVVK